MIHHYLTDEEILHLNMLHVVEVCSTCEEFNTQTSKCKKRNIIVNSNFQRCT